VGVTPGFPLPMSPVRVRVFVAPMMFVFRATLTVFKLMFVPVFSGFCFDDSGPEIES
jgi:hypothetical protein